MNKMVKMALLALITFSTLFSACLFEDDEDEWDAAKVCPEAGTNAYGDPNRGTFVDERDGRVYKYTTIGDQVWMAENLKFELPYPYSLCYGMETCKLRGYAILDTVHVCSRDTTHLAEIAQRMQSTCTDNDCIATEWCEKVGRYYSLTKDGKDGGLLDRDIVDSVCPKGWHVPSRGEWEVFINSVGGVVPRIVSEGSYVAMDSVTAYYRRKDGGPIDVCGFSLNYAGYFFYNGALEYIFDTSHFETSTNNSEVTPYVMYIGKEFGFEAMHTKQSLRCVKDK